MLLAACLLLSTITLGVSQSSGELYVLVAQSYQQGIELTKLYRNTDTLPPRWDQLYGSSEYGQVTYFKVYNSSHGNFTKRITVCDYFGSSLVTDADDCSSLDSSATTAYSFYGATAQTPGNRRIAFETCFDPIRNISYSVVEMRPYCAYSHHRVLKAGHFYAIALRKLCEPPYAPENGLILSRVYDDPVRVESVTFGCNTGYEIGGSDTVNCGVYGIWRPNRMPTCNAVSCGRPTIEHGRPEGRMYLRRGRQFTFGDSTLFECDEGYNLVPSNTSSQCLASGNWSVPSGQCKPVNCGPPPPLQNAHISGSDFTFDQWVHYACNEGYRFDGRRGSLRCHRDGRWMGGIGHCRPRTCYRPPVPLNGTLIGDDFSYGSTVQFECDEGFTLVGHSTLTCGTPGWIGFRPTCEASG